jgi:hypothetical protein
MANSYFNATKFNLQMPDAASFMERLGFVFEVNPFDDTLEISGPATIDVQKIRDELWEIADPIKARLYFRRQRAMHQFVGGSLSGKTHQKYFGCAIVNNLKRGQWEAYYVGRDGRAFFMGTETNKRRARDLAYKKGPPVHGPEFK